MHRKISGKPAKRHIKKKSQRPRMRQLFNIIIEQGEDGYLISEVVELPGCHTKAKNYDELLKRTKEAIALYLDTKKPTPIKTKFLSLQQLEV